MAKKKKSKKPVGRPRKTPVGIEYSEYFTTISVTHELKDKLKFYRSKSEGNYAETIATLIEIMEKIGKDYFGIEKPTPQMVIDGIYKAEHEASKEGKQ